MTIDLDAIEAVARGATPGPWEVRRGEPWVIAKGWGDLKSILHVELPKNQTPTQRADMHHIATMNPQTTLALVNRVRELEAIVREGARKAGSYDEWCTAGCGCSGGGGGDGMNVREILEKVKRAAPIGRWWMRRSRHGGTRCEL